MPQRFEYEVIKPPQDVEMNSSHQAHQEPKRRSVTWMVAGIVGFVILLSGLLTLLPSEGAHQPPDNPAWKISIVLTADDGSMVGFSESELILAEMTSIEHWYSDSSSQFCENVVHGMLMNQHVLVVTTGIGTNRAALCLRGLLAEYHDITREVLFLGTGGFSPAKGGILDSDDCNSTAPAATTELVALGDVCVSPITAIWDCHKCVWPSRINSACSAAPCTLFGRDDLFGDFGCMYYTTTQLAEEVILASRSRPPLEQSPVLQNASKLYWDAMSEGTGEPYNEHLRLKTKLFDYTECGEATSSTFWVGSPYDELSRDYVAKTINHAFSSRLFNEVYTPRIPLKRPLTKRDTVGVSAMEGAGWMEVLALEEVYLHYPRIPAVNLRGAADFVIPPLRREPDGAWIEQDSYLESLDGGDLLTVEGYKMAIRSTSEAVLNLFRYRNETGFDGAYDDDWSDVLQAEEEQSQ